MKGASVLRFTQGKRKARKAQAPAAGGRTPAWWVKTFLAVGRPLLVLLGLAVLAPAERHLAEIAGYDPRVCWGVAIIVSAYGGMAALTAAYVDRDHPDRRTALWGAYGAILSGSLSQVFAHLITTGYIGVEPRPPVLLVVLPSVAPVAIIGHLLHLSWVRVGDAPAEAPTGPTGAREPVVVPEDEPAREHPVEEPEEIPYAGLATYEETAALCGVTASTVRGWAHNKTIRGRAIEIVHRDGKPHFRKEDLPGQVTAEQRPLESVA